VALEDNEFVKCLWIALCLVAVVATAGFRSPQDTGQAGGGGSFAPATNSVVPKAGRRRETVRADVDGDDVRDWVYHDWIRGAAILGVCTGDGRADRMTGSGMTELLEIIDVHENGRNEIFYGGTSAIARYLNIAVFRRGSLRRVLRPRRRPLVLIDGIELAERGGTERPIGGGAFGCQDTAGDRTKELVQVTAWRKAPNSRIFRWKRKSFSIKRAVATGVLVESGRKRARGDEFEVATSLVARCPLEAGR
jgi:hypothetical protein